AVENVTETVQETVGKVKEAVSDSVEAVKETVEESVGVVKDALNFKRHTERHPWLMFGGAGGARLPGRRAPRGGPRAARAGGPRREERGAFPQLEPIHPEPAAQARPEEPSWFSRLGSTFGDELSKLKGLAVGATLGVVRDMLTSAAPDQLKSQLTEVV